MKQKKSFTRTLRLWVALLIVGVVISITLADIFISYRDFKITSEHTRQNYISSQKQMIKNQVIQVVNLINYKRSLSEARVRKYIKARVNEAYTIAFNIFEQNRDNKTRTEIEKMILDALRPIRFANGSGYYFIIRMDGTEVLFADRPEMEGLDMLAIRDTQGKSVVRDMIRLVRQSGEGFYEYHWTKPRIEGNDFKKISFVKLFKPFSWIIGTGLYIDSIKKEIEQELLGTISKIRFGREGYIFVNRLNGDALVSNGKVLSGKKKLWEEFNFNPEQMKRIFDKEYAAASKPSGDYIYYSFIKLTTPDRISPKVSFIYGLPDMGWLIGAGVYLDDVEKEIARLQSVLNQNIKERIVVFSLVALLILCVCLLCFNRMGKKLVNDIKIFISFFRKAAFSNQTINRELVHYRELDRIAESVNRMIAEKAKAEEQLRMFKTFSDSSTEGMGWTTTDHKFVYVNPAMASMLGEKNPSAPIGRDVVTTYYPEEEQEKLLNVIRPALIEKGEWSGELMLRKKNGELVPTRNSLFLIYDDNNEPLYFANIVIDLTEQKRAEEERENLEKQLHVARKMRSIGLMAGGVAHDLNNILAGIVGYPELMLHRLPADSEFRKPLEAIRQSGQKAARVVADLLTIARGAASVRENHDINQLVKKYFDSPEYRALIVSYPGISWHFALDAKHAVISCSPVHVQKCIMNLVTNACEAISGKGTITVTSSNQQVDENMAAEYALPAGEYVVVSVQDTGEGISQEDLEHIFEPFYTKKVMGKSGSGLGLAVVWNTMEDHGGKVIVESSEKGTCFKLFFPVSTEVAAGQQEEDGNIQELRGNGEHVLVVDDEEQLRDVAKGMLEMLGYTVHAVDSGEAAVEFVKKHPVDLILLDMLMEPGMNGLETYEKILKLYPGQKAVIASGFSESDDVREAMRLGAGAFIRKPFTIGQLGRVVKQVLRNAP